VFVEWLWYERSAVAAAGRVALTPLSWLFGAGVRLRNALYDTGGLRSSIAAIPVASVGNLAIGGTGKTPFVAFLANRLKTLGGTPAIVMRGFGDDEWRTYEYLSPGVAVVVDPDRVSGVARAADAGADVAILDDAFQHRRIKRDADVVLLSADRESEATALIPAGPRREPFSGLRRASMAVVVRKAADEKTVQAMLNRVKRAYPSLETAAIALLPDSLASWASGVKASLDALRGKSVLAVSAIGDPRAFLHQVKALAGSVELMAYRDHHRFTSEDVQTILARAGSFDMVVCTLKDVVKLGPLWPRQGPELWYVCQRLEIDWGATEIDRMLARLLDLRHLNRQ
jgi:tetraacyldisaccharide 4'-kinase